MDVYLRLSDERKSHLLSFPFEGHFYYPSIIHCGRQRYCENNQNIHKAHDHSVYHFLLFLDGENEFLFNDKRVPSTRGLFVLCSPGDRHNFFPEKEGFHDYIELTFEYISREKRLNLSIEEILFHLFNMAGKEKGKKFYILDESGIDRFSTLHSQLYYRLVSENREKCDYHIDLLLQKIFLFVLDMVKIEENLSGAGFKYSINRTAQLKDIIHNRFPLKMDLGEISKEIGISKSYLIKKFREEMGITPLDYDRRLRINAAADLIISTNRTLEDIALSLGFCDVFYFIKTFKRYKGVTPGKYR